MATKNNEGTTKSVNTLLIVLLIVAAFLIGSLWTNVQNLQKGSTFPSTTINNNQVLPTQAYQPPAERTKTDTVVLTISKTDHIRGNKNSPLAIIEYSDLECPFCKLFHPTMKRVLEAYKDRVMWVYRHYPLSRHFNAEKEAEATECASEQGGDEAFWKYVDKVFEKTTSDGTGFALTQLTPLAKELGLEEAKFKNCLDKGKYASVVQDQLLQGQNDGVDGTPGVFVLNISTGKTQIIPGNVPFEQVKTVLDQMLLK